MTENTHYTNDFLDAFQSWLDTTEINLCDISIKEALQSAFEAGYDYCVEHNRYLKEALIIEQQKVNKMKCCENCKHYIDSDCELEMPIKCKRGGYIGAITSVMNGS